MNTPNGEKITRTGTEIGASLGEVGEWKDKLNRKNPSWNEVLKKDGNVPGSRVKKN